MPSHIPRRLVEELITSWELTGDQTVLVEGPEDQRFLQLVQSQSYCDETLASLHILFADAVEIPADMVARHGFDGTGAKQRVVAFAREIEAVGCPQGFRCIVDRDQDCRVGRDFRSEALKYTDLGCMQLYGWSPDALRQLLVQFQCETALSRSSEVRGLYDSINDACNVLAAIRVVATRNSELELRIEHVDGAITVKNTSVIVKLSRLLERARIPRNVRTRVEEEIAAVHNEIRALEPLACANDHDLVWILLAVLRGLSKLQRHLLHRETIAGAIVSNGIASPSLLEWPLFVETVAWAAA